MKILHKVIKFYRDGFGYKTDCKGDSPQVVFFDTLELNLNCTHYNY